MTVMDAAEINGALVTEGKSLEPLNCLEFEPKRQAESGSSAADSPPVDLNRSTDDDRKSAALAEAVVDLARDPLLFRRVGEAMTARGYAGDVRPPKIAYVAITSRFLDRPVNLVVIAESASGKNAAVDAARAFHPPEAVYAVSAASPMALIYSVEDFQHRCVFFKEADSIADDGHAGSIIRSLAEDSMVSYDVTEMVKGVDPKTKKKSEQRQTRRIEKPGPTGLITTSTKSLGHQLSTRMLEISLQDDPAQTRAVMSAHARRVNPLSDAEPEIDLTPFVGFQQWLAKAGERRVVVPFADVLAELVPNGSVRMRRDFKQLLTFIQAIALLYQFQRDRTADGAIIATIDDYAEARTLLGPLFEAIIAEGLTPAIRETVELIGTTEIDVTQIELGKRQALRTKNKPRSKSTISWRVDRAIAQGWLINDAWKGQPARLRRGAPLPDAETGLPSVADVRDLFELLSGFESSPAA